MSKCTIALSANAGICIAQGSSRLWFDMPHCEKDEPFSRISPELWGMIKTSELFEKADHICFTHCHIDHFSKEMTMEAKALWPNATLVLPEKMFDEQLLIEGCGLTFGESPQVSFFPLPHSGSAYADMPHYGAFVSSGERNVLLPGDCRLAAPELEAWLNGRSVDIAVLDFPWLTLPRGREFIADVIKPRHAVIYHLPFPNEDRWGYCKAAANAAPLLAKQCDLRLLLSPMQAESFD